jgi:hypothetical protein
MARIFLTAIDLNKNELLRAKLQTLPTVSAPTLPVQGQVYYDSTKLTIGVYETSGTPAWRYAAISGAIVDADIASGAAIAAAKLSLANAISATEINTSLKPSSGAATTVEALRAIGTTANNAMAGNSTLNSIAAATATSANVAMNNFTFTGLAAPTGDNDAATKAYVDAARTGIDAKASVRVATTAALSGVTYTATNGASGRGQITGAPTTIDGVTLVANNRILIKDGAGVAGAPANGIWVVSTLGTGSNGVWDRATDFDTDAKVTAGAYVWVEEGTDNLDSAWVLTTNNPIVIGGGSGTALTWVLFSSAGQLIAGNGLTKDSNTINVVGTTNRISVSTGAVDISASYVGQTTITTLGTITAGTWNGTDIAVADGGTGASDAVTARANLGATTKFTLNNLSTNSSVTSGTVTWTVTHNLGTKDVQVQVRQVSNDQVVEMDVFTSSTSAVSIQFNAASLPADNTYRCVVIG